MIADVNIIFIDKYKELNDYKNINNKIFVKSKSDKLKNIKNNTKVQYISVKTGKGIDLLLKKVFHAIGPEKKISDINVSRERHRNALKKTLEYLQEALLQKNIDLFAEDVRYANREISKISGNIDIEDVLDMIFNDFCIGK